MTEAERIRRVHCDRLTRLAADVEAAQKALASAVEDARDYRISWNFIGPAVGMSRQGARQRWGL